MKNKVNMTGIKLEQCVLDNDELDYIEQDYELSKLYEYPMTPEESYLEVPDDIDNPIEYIEKDMDSQPNDDNFDKILLETENGEPVLLPSAMNYEDWLIKNYNTEDSKVLYDKYLMGIRKELREWWFNNPRNSLFIPRLDQGSDWWDSTIFTGDPLIPENPTIEDYE